MAFVLVGCILPSLKDLDFSKDNIVVAASGSVLEL